MRIRSTKPEFWRSETIGELEWDHRLVLKGLESYVDDNGVGKDTVALICADVFPHDLAKDPETIARVSRALQKLAEVDLIVRYSFKGHRLVYVRRWKSIQRVDKPNAGRYPRPDGTLNYLDDVDEAISPAQPGGEVSSRDDSRKPREDFRSPPDALAPGTGEQGSRGAGEQIPVGTTEVCHQSADDVAPPEKCHRHINTPNPPDCGGCASASRERKAWERRRAADEAKRAQDELEDRRQAKAIRDNCLICKGTNWIPDTDPAQKCDHQETRLA